MCRPACGPIVVFRGRIISAVNSRGYAAFLAAAAIAAVAVFASACGDGVDPRVLQDMGLICGDGIISADEGCDDGNRRGADGCSELCEIEMPWRCHGQPSRCQLCGNGIVEVSEACDDGNTESEGEGYCVADCTSIQICGNGVHEGTEQCDDGGRPGGCFDTCLNIIPIGL